MRVSLIPTHVAGVRQKKSILAAKEPFVGYLSISDWPHGDRTMRMASLVDCTTSQVHRALLAPLFEVELVRMTGDEMWLAGFQIECTSELVPVQYRQGWWIRLTQRPII